MKQWMRNLITRAVLASLDYGMSREDCHEACEEACDLWEQEQREAEE